MSAARPPRLAEGLVEWAAPAVLREHLMGDLEEQFHINLGRRGARVARRRYWRQAFAILWHWPIRPVAESSQVLSRQESFMSALLYDARFAGRQLLRHPSYFAVAVLSLALAISANGVVFGLVNGLVLNPFNYPEGQRLISISGAFPTQGGDRNFIEQHSPAEVQDFAAIPVIEHLGAFDLGNRVLATADVSERLFTALVLYDPTPALGVPMALGRTFTAEELAPGGPSVAILSHRVWQRLFDGDPAVIGKTVRVTSNAATVVGVLGPGSPLLGTDLWIPWGADPALVPRNRARLFTVVARLTDGASIADVDAALQTISARAKTTLTAEYPEYADWRLSAGTWTEAVTGQLSPAGALLLAAGFVVLLVACVNLASLLLARLATRERELAVRRALGASGWRITRLLTIESVIVSGVAALAGVALANAALTAVPSLLPSQVARLGFQLGMNGSIVAYCVLAGAVAAALTILLPAWQTRRAVAPSLAIASRAAAGPARQRGRRALIVTEVALAVTLLVTAGLFLRSYGRIAQIDPGFDPSGLLTMRLTIDPLVYPGDKAAAFFTELTTRLAKIPGVSGVAAVNQMPTTAVFDTTFTVDGAPPSDTLPNAFLTVGSPELFEVLHTPMRAGRALSDRDRDGMPEVAVVNEAFSRRYLNGASTGRLRIGESGTPVEVVGVVADVANQSLMGSVRPEIFATVDQAGGGNNQYFLMLRTSGEPTALAPAARRVLAALDPDQPLYYVQTMEEVIAAQLFPQRLAMVLVGVFALGALAIALIGVYGLISHWVVSRTREIGIRMALGGGRRQVMVLVVGQAIRLMTLGTAIGLAGGIGAGYVASSLLFATAPADPWTLASVASVLVVAGVIAAFLPARRATVIDPVEVLRAE